MIKKRNKCKVVTHTLSNRNKLMIIVHYENRSKLIIITTRKKADTHTLTQKAKIKQNKATTNKQQQKNHPASDLITRGENRNRKRLNNKGREQKPEITIFAPQFLPSAPSGSWRPKPQGPGGSQIQ